ncbi:MAG TPA: aldo/keto reductase [Bacteroides sp.]|nr:aldo/keto reductase [Bacteroides sp.]
MNFQDKTILGKTGLKVGRMGIASSYGAPAEAYEEAFEKGCNYFTAGSFMRGRRAGIVKAIHNIVKKGKREELVVAMAEYTHNRFMGQPNFLRGLKKLGLEYVDVLFLGYYSRKPRAGLISWASTLKEKGLVRHIGISSHNRSLFPVLAEEGIIDVFHVRYNAANRGAESDVFPQLPMENKPGIVSFTATRWGQLLNKKKMPPGEEPLSASDCYRFVLSNPSVDLCLTGTRNHDMMRENLKTLELGPLTEEEMKRIRLIGDYVYGKPRA